MIKRREGFTLIELLIVIAIIAILAVTVYVAINPVGRFADARNSRRYSDVNSILTAIHQCIVDNDGILADCGLVDNSSHNLGEEELDLSEELSPYLKAIPQDPQEGTNEDTGYSIIVNTDNIVTVTAEYAEAGEEINVSR